MITLDSIIEASKGHFITVKFVKKDGSVRTMNCRTGVIKHLRGGKCTVDKNKFLIVYDVKSEGYRSINRNSIVSVLCDGVEYFNEGTINV
jgi:hypothetical protein